MVATSLVMLATTLVMVASSLVMVVTTFVMMASSLVMVLTSLVMGRVQTDQVRGSLPNLIAIL